MTVKSFGFLINLFTILITVSACQTVLPPSTALPKGIAAAPPPGYNAMCQRVPSECVLPMSTQTHGLLGNLHIKAKEMVVPTWEEEGGDFWQSLTKRGPGDCEDFALTLRRELREVMPEYAGAFRLATAYTETMQYHAILTIETTEGTIVCDIRFPQCAGWETFPYKWHLREVVGQPSWQNISYAAQQALVSPQRGAR